MATGGMGWSKRRGEIAEITSVTGGLDQSFLWHQLQTVADLLAQVSVRPFWTPEVICFAGLHYIAHGSKTQWLGTTIYCHGHGPAG